MYQQFTMLPLKAVEPLRDHKIFLHLNISRRKFLDIQFPFDMSSHKTPMGHSRGVKNEISYRFLINLLDIQTVQKVSHDGDVFSLIVVLDSPPRFFRRFNDIASSHASSGRYWNSWDSWYRQTDIVSNPSLIKGEAIALKKPNAIIDIGRFSDQVFELDVANLGIVRTLDNVPLSVQGVRDRLGEPGLLSGCPGRL